MRTMLIQHLLHPQGLLPQLAAAYSEKVRTGDILPYKRYMQIASRVYAQKYRSVVHREV